MCIVGNLVGIHGGSWHLDASTEVDVVVTQMVGELLQILLLDPCGVIYNIVMDWKSSGNCGSVGNEEEIKLDVSLSLH
jgi:hypothetical protein